MKFFVDKKVLAQGIKIVFVTIENVNNQRIQDEWMELRKKKIEELYKKYSEFNIKDDKILEGYHLLHDHIHVKRRKNVPASENLIRLLIKRKDIGSINQIVDIYNLISLETKIALGAHDMDQTDGNVTLRFTNGSESFHPLGKEENMGIQAGEYAYVDDSNSVLCRLEIRQVIKTLVRENTKNVWYIVQGNEYTSQEQLIDTARQIIDVTTKYCQGTGRIIIPEVIDK
ncbi:MAG: B3/4 domain-containing protein [Floccifex sp.]